jgi:putative intracellular protease/amidase
MGEASLWPEAAQGGQLSWKRSKEDKMEEASKLGGSPAEVAERIADSHARAVVFPKMQEADSPPVGEIAQRMVDGTFDKDFLVSEIERFTGVKVNIPDNPGKVLAIIPEHGYWSSELTLTDRVFRAAGYEVDYVTHKGNRPFVYGVSTDTTFKDQAWNAAQVSPGEAKLGELYNDPNSDDGQRLNQPRNLDAWLPPTPRPHDEEQSREPFREKLAAGLREASEYAAAFIVGGAGAYMDLGGNTSVRPLIQLMVALERPVAAICYGVSVLIQATDPETDVPLVWGRLVTGHSEQDDYTDFTANVVAEGEYSPNYGAAVFTLEQMIKQYTGPEGGFLSNDGTPYMAVADGPFISARTTPDGYPAALLTLARLHGEGQLPEKFVIDGDGAGHEPAADEVKRPRL